MAKSRAAAKPTRTKVGGSGTGVGGGLGACGDLEVGAGVGVEKAVGGAAIEVDGVAVLGAIRLNEAGGAGEQGCRAVGGARDVDVRNGDGVIDVALGGDGLDDVTLPGGNGEGGEVGVGIGSGAGEGEGRAAGLVDALDEGGADFGEDGFDEGAVECEDQEQGGSGGDQDLVLREGLLGRVKCL